MPKKKQLKVNGHSITSFDVQVKSIEGEVPDTLIDVIYLTIHVDTDTYRYDIRKDERAPDVYKTRNYIEATLTKAQEDLLNVEISEYTERMYLFFKVQSIGQVQYTGYRV